MKALTFLQQITPSQNITKQTLFPQTNHHRSPPPPPPRTWRLSSGAKGFTTKDGGSANKKRSGYPARNEAQRKNINDEEDDDDKIPEVVWQRMIPRILFYVGVPMAVGLGFLQAFSVMKVRELWDVPKWLPFVTSLLSFGASALGIAYGTLSTSLDENEEGSLLGFEQVEKNWVEVWKQEAGDS